MNKLRGKIQTFKKHTAYVLLKKLNTTVVSGAAKKTKKSHIAVLTVVSTSQGPMYYLYAIPSGSEF